MGPSSPTVSLIDRQIRTRLEQSPYQIEFYTEYMDTNLFPDNASQKEIRQWYLHKYRGRRPDAIVAVATAPIQFMAEAHTKFFPYTPIVFCCAREDQIDGAQLDSEFTGVWMKLDPGKTIEAALHMRPQTRHVVVVGGSAASDRDLEDLVRHSLRPYESRVDVTYLTDLAMPRLLERLKHLPQQTIVLFVNIQQDAAGTHFLSATQALPMVTSAANAPVFVMADTLLGQGAVGGYVTSFSAQGQALSEIVTRLLNDTKPQAIPIVRDASVYIFDWGVLRRWGLKERNLPPGAIVLNRQPTVWEAYQRYIIAGSSLCLVEMLFIFALLWQRAKRIRVQSSLVDRLEFERLLSDLSTTFINLHEGQVEQKIEQGLGRIAELLQMDRITLFEFAQDGRDLIVKSAWPKEGLSHLPPRINADRWPWWASNALRGAAVLCSDPKLLPDEASFERDYLLQTGVQSIASVPLQIGGGTIGCMSFVSKTRRVAWTEDLLRQLKVFAEIFSNALKRKWATQALVATIADVKKAEAGLRESEERFRLVANTAPVLIWMSDPDSRCSYVNKSWVDFTGRDIDSEVGNGWTKGIFVEDFQKCIETYEHAFDQRERFQLEYRLRRHDGKYRWMVDIGVPRFNADGSFAGYIGSAIDVTERKLAEEALSGFGRKLIDAQEKERTRIARELHDDINQRLALLAVELEQLAQNSSTDVVELSTHVRELSKHVAEIGTAVQAISHRLHSSKLEYLGIVGAAKSFCNEFSEQHQVKIDFWHKNIPATVPRDASLCLFRILQEALHNAVKHSGVRHFYVNLVGGANVVELTVQDSGIGFDTQTATNNPGLGLVSMRERASLVVGKISIASKPGCGTLVNVRVPIAESASTGPSMPSKVIVGAVYGLPSDVAS
jgi:PAS domain S-box-containing protein